MLIEGLMRLTRKEPRASFYKEASAKGESSKRKATIIRKKRRHDAGSRGRWKEGFETYLDDLKGLMF